jgi:hypothetical protein
VFHLRVGIDTLLFLPVFLRLRCLENVESRGETSEQEGRKEGRWMDRIEIKGS